MREFPEQSAVIASCTQTPGATMQTMPSQWPGRIVVAFATSWLATSLVASAQPAPTAPATGDTPTTTFYLRNWTRSETLYFFEPKPGGGDPDYSFIANRLQAGIRIAGARWELAGALQYVQFGGLPTDAFGPGALGTGALYYDASQDTSSSQIYLKALNARLRLANGVFLLAGRMPYASGGESPSGVAAIETVKRQRLDSRLIGEFEWSIYQRAFDGVRLDVDRPTWHATTSVMMPTQGGFEESANVTMTNVVVVAANLGIKPAALAQHTDVQVFGDYYDDHRDVRARPDNTGLSADRVDVSVTTIGTSVTGVYPSRAGEIDTLAWFAAQAGDWYGQDHTAFALSLEAGHRWPSAPWAPWLRGGINYSSGDNDDGDEEHGTFFQMLPTGRKYSFSAAYTQMNLRDIFGQVILRPHRQLTARLDVRRLDLAQGNDRWYAGSGATQSTGTFFGYSVRASGGATSFGTVIEAAADLTINRKWSVNGYVGAIAGGDVVRNLFAGDRLTFFYFENVLSF
jgi:hypothetical protein